MKNNTGLSSSDIEAIKTVAGRCDRVEKVLIFGSRAKGTYQNGSDVDLALKGRNLSFTDISRISDELNEETIMPYRFDVLDYNRISEPKLKEHINRNGILIFNRAPKALSEPDTRSAK